MQTAKYKEYSLRMILNYLLGTVLLAHFNCVVTLQKSWTPPTFSCILYLLIKNTRNLNANALTHAHTHIRWTET